jgi:hypothetical protein
MLDENRNIILPSLWEQVVKPSATLQVSLPSDILDPDIMSRYPYIEEAPYVVKTAPAYHPRSASVVLPDDDAGSQEAFDVIESIPDDDSDGIESLSESEFDSMSSGSEGFDSAGSEETPDEIPRQVTVPTDDDGNSLVFQVNTAFSGPPHRASTNADTSHQTDKRDPQELAGNAEHLEITKAVSAQSNGRTSLQVYVLPGPRTPFTDPNISIRWFHLHSERLDFASFRGLCLGISGLTERLRKLVRQLFDKVEKDKLKVFLGGMFIEPGTVLRADESHQPDIQSVTFSCVPYFDLHVPARKTPATANRFSSRTLMQSYYPYEPVQERDAEQAYRIFGNERHNALVHVPNMWMLNIGPNIVATCGHEALSKELVQSIEVVQTSHLREKGDNDGQVPAVTVRLRDWNHRKLLYTLEECRSFFQMEQRLRELRWCSTRTSSKKSMQLSWHTSAGTVRVTPGLWPGTVRQRDAIFIDLSMPSDGTDDNEIDTDLQTSSPNTSPSIPFFHWPLSQDTGKTRTDFPMPDDIKRSIQCLESVEKAMLQSVLSSYGSHSAVEKTFTTTVYYRNLPEETGEHVKTGVHSLPTANEMPKDPRSDLLTVHEALVRRQQHVIAKKTLELCDSMQKTLALFVGHVDKSTMLRKLWAAMQSISDIANASCQKRPRNYDDGSMADNMGTSQGWYVRPDMDSFKESASFQKARRTFEKCSRCSSNVMYNTSKAAVLHLNKHLRLMDRAISDAVRPEQWIASNSQKELETWIDGTAKILTVACQIAQRLFFQAKELSDGVRNEDGQMSALYTFPRPLLSAFRQLLVFYFSVERSLFFTEEALSDRGKATEASEHMAGLPFSPEGLQVIEAFGNGVQQALASAREELCSMVKSKEPVDVFKRLSLSPEYVSGWLMRRLLVKPLEKSMTVSDMYREYLSTIVSSAT